MTLQGKKKKEKEKESGKTLEVAVISLAQCAGKLSSLTDIRSDSPARLANALPEESYRRILFSLP